MPICIDGTAPSSDSRGGIRGGGGAQPDDKYPLPSLNAIYVLPSARRAGACREMLADFFAAEIGRAHV